MRRGSHTPPFHDKHRSVRIRNYDISWIFTENIVPIKVSSNEMLWHNLVIAILGQRPRDFLIHSQDVRERKNASAADTASIRLSLSSQRGRGLANPNETSTAGDKATQSVLQS